MSDASGRTRYVVGSITSKSDLGDRRSAYRVASPFSGGAASAAAKGATLDSLAAEAPVSSPSATRHPYGVAAGYPSATICAQGVLRVEDVWYGESVSW